MIGQEPVNLHKEKPVFTGRSGSHLACNLIDKTLEQPI